MASIRAFASPCLPGFEVEIPDEYKGQLETGKEIHYLNALGRKKITRV